jgi:transglutaminase-like putative cysteine protease
MLAPADRVRRRRVRGAAATLIVLAWAAALGGLVRREVGRSPRERLTEMARRVNPGNVFYAVEHDGRHVGWASATIDTLADSVSLRSDTLALLDELVAEYPVRGVTQRTATRTQVILSRAFVLRRFVVDIDRNGTATRISGRAVGDTGIAFVVETNGAPSDTQWVRISGAVFLPTMLPLATILRGDPKVGRRSAYLTFDPSSRTARDVTMEVMAESLFVVDDSARMDSESGRWVAALRDTVRAWKVAAVSGRGFDGWVDAQGRVVATTQFGALGLRRMAYELSFENWRLGTRVAARTTNPERDIRASSVIAAEIAVPARRLQSLKARLMAPSLAGFALRGGRQQLDGNVLTITTEGGEQLKAAYSLPPTIAHRTRFRNELQAEPFLQTRAPAVLRQAITIVRHEREPGAIVGLLTKWVSDSVKKAATFTMPDAMQVLRSRRGDCNEHTQLFAALARSLDIPTRIASGLEYIDGAFYYHSWPEVFLGDWVAVDPTFGQFPADAAHIRLAIGGLERQAELLRLVATLRIEVLAAR